MAPQKYVDFIELGDGTLIRAASVQVVRRLRPEGGCPNYEILLQGDHAMTIMEDESGMKREDFIAHLVSRSDDVQVKAPTGEPLVSVRIVDDRTTG